MKKLTEKDLQAKEKLLKRPIAEDEKVSPPIFGTCDQYHLLIEKFAIPGTSGNGVVFLEEEVGDKTDEELRTFAVEVLKLPKWTRCQINRRVKAEYAFINFAPGSIGGLLEIESYLTEKDNQAERTKSLLGKVYAEAKPSSAKPELEMAKGMIERCNFADLLDDMVSEGAFRSSTLCTRIENENKDIFDWQNKNAWKLNHYLEALVEGMLNEIDGLTCTPCYDEEYYGTGFKGTKEELIKKAEVSAQYVKETVARVMAEMEEDKNKLR